MHYSDVTVIAKVKDVVTLESEVRTVPCKLSRNNAAALSSAGEHSQAQ